jgi:signal transduction histidine kinase
VPNDALQNIFRPFFRINGTERQSEGNGLGLAIALGAIRLHGGTITASNLNPQGLEISVQLPVPEPASLQLVEALAGEWNVSRLPPVRDVAAKAR